MAKQIKISADNSEVRKSILDIKKSAEQLSRSKIDLLSADTKKFLKGEAVAQAKRLSSEINNQRKAIESQVKALDQVKKGSKEELKLKTLILERQKEINRLVKQQNDLQNVSKDLGIRGQLKGMEKLPGMGKLGKFLRGGLIGGGLAVAGLGVLHGASRLRAGFGTFREGIDDRLRLMGRGVTDLDVARPGAAAAAGMNALSLRQARLRDIDIFGRGGATQSAVIQRAMQERSMGIEQGTFAGIGQSLRGSIGARGAQKAVMQLQASLIASGITDEIGPYLQTASDMLVSLNERGFTFDDSALAALGAMIDTTGRVERSGRLIQSIDSAIRGSSGEANSFFQAVFGMAGIGGGTVGGAQAAIRSGGLFGADLSKIGQGISATDRRAFEAIGLGKRSGQTVAASTLGMLDQMFGSDKEINALLGSQNQGQRQAGALNRLSRNRFIMRTFGLQNETEAAEVNKLLQILADPKTTERKREQAKQQMAKIQEGSTELGNLKRINESTAGSLDVLKNLRDIEEDVIGGRIAPAIESAQRALLRIDQMISKLLGFFGFDTAQEDLEEAIGGSEKLTSQMIEGMSPAEKEAALTRMESARNSLEAKRAALAGDSTMPGRDKFFQLSQLDQRIATQKANIKSLGGSLAGPTPMTEAQMSNLIENLKNPGASSKAPTKEKELVEWIKRQVEVMQDVAKSSKDTAKHTRGMGGLPAATAKTVGK